MHIDFVDKFQPRGGSFKFMSKVIVGVVWSQQREQPLIPFNEYTPAAFTVHEALHNAATAALRQHGGSNAVVAAIVKYIGKGFGILACTNVSLRDASWRTDVSLNSFDSLPLDCKVRFEDAVAAAHQFMKPTSRHKCTSKCG